MLAFQNVKNLDQCMALDAVKLDFEEAQPIVDLEKTLLKASLVQKPLVA